MLRFDRPSPYADALADSCPSESTIGLAALFSLLRANILKASLILAAFVALGLDFALTSTPLFTATTNILFDPRLSHPAEGDSGNRSLAELGLDTASVDSQVAILNSQSLALDVLRRLKLESDPSFATPTTLPGRLLAGFRNVLTGPRPDSLRDGVAPDILEGFTKSLYAKRVQQTYVITIGFTARTPALAALVANTVASTFADNEIRAKLRLRQAEDSWLTQKIADARTQVASAEQVSRTLQDQGQVRHPDGAVRSTEQALNSKRLTYEAFVQRADALRQQQFLPVSSVKVLAEARPPMRKSQPNTLLILVLSTAAGLAAALGVIAYGEATEKTYRVPSQVEADLQIRFLGVLPTKSESDLMQRFLRWAQRYWQARPVPPIAAYDDYRDRTMRAAKVAVDIETHHDGLALVAVVSAMSGEGRSTVAAGLADLLAASGRRTLLVDADLRHPVLSERRARQRHHGLSEFVGGLATLRDAVVPGTAGADFLPASASTISHSSAIFDLAGLQKLITAARDDYDYAILDLPPLATNAETTALIPKIGTFLLVVAWGETERAIVAETVRSTPLLQERMAGAVFTKVDLRAFKRMARSARDARHVAERHMAGQSRLRRT